MEHRILFCNYSSLIKQHRHTANVGTERIKERNKEINKNCKVERHTAPERHMSTQPVQ